MVRSENYLRSAEERVAGDVARDFFHAAGGQGDAVVVHAGPTHPVRNLRAQQGGGPTVEDTFLLDDIKAGASDLPVVERLDQASESMSRPRAVFTISTPGRQRDSVSRLRM